MNATALARKPAQGRFRSSRSRPVPERMGDGPTPERRAQNGGTVAEPQADGANRRVLVHRARYECWLDVYRRAGRLTEAEFSAGLRFRTAWLTHVEGIKTRDSMDLADAALSGGGPTLTPSERRSWAEATIREAYATLTVWQALVVDAVCGCDQSAGNAARMKTFVRGLEALAKHWGLQ